MQISERNHDTSSILGENSVTDKTALSIKKELHSEVSSKPDGVTSLAEVSSKTDEVTSLAEVSSKTDGVTSLAEVSSKTDEVNSLAEVSSKTDEVTSLAEVSSKTDEVTSAIEYSEFTYAITNTEVPVYKDLSEFDIIPVGTIVLVKTENTNSEYVTISFYSETAEIKNGTFNVLPDFKPETLYKMRTYGIIS